MSDPAASNSADTGDPAQLRPWTLPNLITLARFLLIGPLCWMILTGAAHGTWTPVVLFAVWASTDWVDGFLARALGQVSRFGAGFDPVADRLGITLVLVSLTVIGAVDWWLLAVIVAVDVLLVVVGHRRLRDGTLTVSWLGKWRTAVLLTAIVFMVLGVTAWPPVTPVATALMYTGVALHVVAGIGYIQTAHRLPGAS
ncbi:MAG: CDP-alcohol phosphatidyltransferase family protein [Propioniciclava sp.]